jgi:hypothetical protein
MEEVDRILISLIAFAPRLIGFALWIIAKAGITGTKLSVSFGLRGMRRSGHQHR